MANYASKLTGAAIAALLVSLPADEGIPMKNGMAKPYFDQAGLPTVCYGHMDRKLDMTRLYSMDECNAFLKADLEKHMARVGSCMKREPTLGQLIAFTSMDFNTGGWCGSRSMREFNIGNNTESCRALSTSVDGTPAWSYIKGAYSRGLQLRRKREEAVCLKGMNVKQTHNYRSDSSYYLVSFDPLVQFQDGVLLSKGLRPGPISDLTEV